jgi:rfaE bifunctional protein kinase chain/domain
VNKKNKKFIEIIDAFPGKEVIVWGDILLDEYLYGNTRRISREAPVLILSYKNKELSLGGAGNSLLNLHALGAKPIPVGVIGKDAAGENIVSILKKKSIPTKYLRRSKAFATPTKTRIFAGEETARKQQILRIDHEGHAPEDESTKSFMVNSLKELKAQAKALLISDYNYYVVRKDVYQKVLPLYRLAAVPVTLDSRFRILDFKGISVSTPNESEVEDALKIEINDDQKIIHRAGRQLILATEAESVLITRGSRGMILFERGKNPVAIPVQGTTDIVDVTGAGDTVISVFSLVLACGGNFKDAARIANHAGGLVVMKKGTATLTPDELKRSILKKN